MSETEHGHSEDLDLWLKYRQAAASPGACPDPLELAAYIDRMAGTELSDRIESHLADCSQCLGAICDVMEHQRAGVGRTAITPDAVAIPPALEHAIARSQSRWRLVATFARRSIAAAASIVISFVAFRAGSLLALKDAPVDSDETLAAAMTFGLSGESDLTFGDGPAGSEIWQ